jgi:general secretion pathway protein D
MRALLPLLLAALVAACTTIPEVEDGKRLIAEGQTDEGLQKLERAARDNPTSAQARAAFAVAREQLVTTAVRQAEAARIAGDLLEAERFYLRALQLDPASAVARNGLDAIAAERRWAQLVAEAEVARKGGSLDAAEAKARAVLRESSGHRGARAVLRAINESRAKALSRPPQLTAALGKPITLEFRDAPIRSVFEVISRSSGINFVFDRDVRPDIRVTIFVRNINLEDVIKLLLVTNQLERKVINENSVLVFPNTPAKLKDYQELVTRSFYLANADAKQTAAMIRALVKTRDLYIDEKLNLVVMKDTVDAVRLAEQLVATQDLGEPEVMLEVEVLEVAASLIREFGIKYPERINYGVLGGGIETSTTTSTATTITSTQATPPPFTTWTPSNWTFFVANPVFIANLRQNDGTLNLLANPRIRVKNRDKAKIHIGERVPVITTTSTANVGVSSSVSYLDTGLKLDVEPNVYLEDEVAIKMQLEVSNILEQLNISGTVAYRLGTRQTATTLRLRDGETQVLAGLISDEDRRAASKVPYLGDLPITGRLFSNTTDQRTKSEIVMLLTPRVVRNIVRPETVAVEFRAGTEAAPGAPAIELRGAGPRSLALAPAGPAGATQAPQQAPKPPAAPAAPAQQLSLVWAAPSQAAVGSEFVVSLGLPGGSDVKGARVELVYDPAVLSASASGAPDPGRTTVEIAGPGVAGAAAPPPTQARFRVVAKAPATAQIQFANASAVDAGGNPVALTTPGSHAVTIQQPQGSN